MRLRCLLMSTLLLWGCPPSERGAEEETSGDEDIMFPDEREAQREASHPATETVARGERTLAEGDLDGAQALFEEAIAEDDEDPRAHLDLGLVFELRNQYEAAEREYRRALAIDGDFVEAINNLGLLLRDLERTDEAIQLLSRAVDLRADFGEAWLNLGMAHEESGDASAAREAYRRATQLLPRDPMPRMNLGLLLLQAGETDQAAIELRRALPLARGNAAALQAIGNGLRRLGEAGGAVRAMSEAVEAMEGGPTPALLAELALAHRANDDREAAEAALARALAIDADYATGHFLLGSMMAARGAYAEAIEHLEATLRLEPRGPHAERARAHLEAARAAAR